MIDDEDMMEEETVSAHSALMIAAKINATYCRTGDPTVGLELHTALYELLEALVGKKVENWRGDDLDDIELAAKAICMVFEIGMTMERDEPLFWVLDM
jgi:hypothetical protein